MELRAVFGASEIQALTGHIAIGSLSTQKVEAQFAQLGGTVKVAELIETIPYSQFTKDPIAVLKDDDFLKKALGETTSVAFAISFFDKPQPFSFVPKKLGIALKKEYRSRFNHARYVESQEPVTSSVTVKRNKLLRGLDLWVVFHGDSVMLARTVAVQDYETFSQFDYGRPKPDAKSGMLPPKLARMMVNFTEGATVLLDPFVGSGTVLQEAALLGIKNLYGSDIEKKAIARTKANMDWIGFQAKLQFELHLSAMPIQKLGIKEYSGVDAVVTEIDLGPPLSKKPSPGEVEGYAKEAAKLVDALMTFVSRLPKIKKCILALPFWPNENQPFFVDFHVPKGFFVADIPEIKSTFQQEANERQGMLYVRENQRVGREILVLQKNSHYPI